MTVVNDALAPDVWAPAPSGDATGTTDTAAVQSLVNSLSTAGGGNLQLQAGVYWGNLTLQPNVRLVGRGKGKTTWRAPAAFSGILLAGLNWATLTGKAAAAGDYLLGAPGVGVVGMTVDGNSHAVNCCAVWGASFLLDDAIFQRATADGLITEFTNVTSFADTTQQLAPEVGSIYCIANGGDGWVNRNQAVARSVVCYSNTGWGLTVDSKDGSYSGGLFVNYLQVFLNANGVRVGNIANPTSSTAAGYLYASLAELDSGTNGVGTGLLLQPCTGNCNINSELAAWATAVDLGGVSHRLNLTMNRNVNGLRLNGCQKCNVLLGGGSGNTGSVIVRTSEGGPNWIGGTVDIPAAATLLSTGAQNFNTQTTILVSANGAGGTFSTVKLPSNQLFNSNGWAPTLPPNSNQLLGTAQSALTYGTTIATDASQITAASITVTNTTAFTISNPTGQVSGQPLTYRITNSSGGVMGAITWGAAFLLAGAFTNPANGKSRTISFYYDSSLAAWVERGRAAADI